MSIIMHTSLAVQFHDESLKSENSPFILEMGHFLPNNSSIASNSNEKKCRKIFHLGLSVHVFIMSSFKYFWNFYKKLMATAEFSHKLNFILNSSENFKILFKLKNSWTFYVFARHHHHHLWNFNFLFKLVDGKAIGKN